MSNKSVLYIHQNYSFAYSSASLSILRAFKIIKQVSLVDFEIKPVTSNRRFNRLINYISLLRQNHFRRQNSRLLDRFKNFKPELVFVFKGTDLLPQTLTEMRAINPSTRFICFNPDNPLNDASSNQNIVQCISLYDDYLIWSKRLFKSLLNYGAKNVSYMPFGVDNEIIYPVDTEYLYDVSFVGNGDAERHTWIKAIDEEISKMSNPFKLHIFGSNWPKFSGNIILHPQVNGKKMLKTISASRININILRKQNKGSINMRTFEIPAVGGFMLHEYSDELNYFLRQGRDVDVFDTATSLVSLAKYYLNNSELCDNIRMSGYEQISSKNNTYKHIIEGILLNLK